MACLYVFFHMEILSYISILFAGKVSNEAVIKFFGNF